MLMKKIFTLIAMAFVAISVNAQRLTFMGALQASYEKDGFKLEYVDTDGKLATDDSKSNNFGTADAYEKIEGCLKTGGKSGSKNNMTLTIPADGTLKVYVRTGSNSATDRNLVLTQNETELYNKVVQETDKVEVGDVSVYPIISVSVKAGTVAVTYPVGSLNFFAFELVSGGGTGEKITYASVTFDGTNVVLSPEFAAVVEPVMDTENPEKVKYYKATNAVGGKSVVTAYDKNGVKVVAVGGTTPSSVTPDLTNKIADVKKEDPENPEKVTKGALYALASAEWKDVQWNPTTVGGKGHSMNNGDKDAIYTLDGTGNPYINIFAEEIWTDGEFTGNYRADYEYYEPDGSKGLPTTGLYYSFNSSVAGAFKVMVWANNGNRPTYVVNATTGSEQFAKAQPLLAEGYINGQDWKQEDADAGTIDASLVGKRKYLSAEQINEIHTSGSQTNQYVIGQGNQPFWGYLMFDVNPGDEYWVFQPSSQIGFGGFEFTPGAKKEDLTKIESIQTKTNNVWNPNAPMYNLSGQKVDKSYKGIVIQNGRKFVNK